jgi:hypothetical protein
MRRRWSSRERALRSKRPDSRFSIPRLAAGLWAGSPRGPQIKVKHGRMMTSLKLLGGQRQDFLATRSQAGAGRGFTGGQARELLPFFLAWRVVKSQVRREREGFRKGLCAFTLVAFPGEPRAGAESSLPRLLAVGRSGDPSNLIRVMPAKGQELIFPTPIDPACIPRPEEAVDRGYREGRAEWPSMLGDGPSASSA